jgi:hypothetical protein
MLNPPTKIHFYELPDLQRSIDIFIGIFASILLEFIWLRRHTFIGYLKKNRFLFDGLIPVFMLAGIITALDNLNMAIVIGTALSTVIILINIAITKPKTKFGRILNS